MNDHFSIPTRKQLQDDLEKQIALNSNLIKAHANLVKAHASEFELRIAVENE